MVKMKPPKVYIHDSILADKLSKKRLDKMISAMEAENLQVVDDSALAEAIKVHKWREMGPKRTGELGRKDDPIVIFNNFRFLSNEENKELARKYPELARYNFLGNGHSSFRDANSFSRGVCKSAHEIHSAWGCYHACDYCHVKDFFNIMLNLEEFVEHLDGLVKREGWQKLYKYDNQTDTICLEPEYGASELLVNYFAKQKDKYLLLYTKSDNVEHLLNLDHRGNTIINWTLSCDTVAREIEKKAPSMDERIEAAAECQKAGYTVRFRFSPIIPIKNWQAENTEMIENMFAKVKPDLITMDVLGWMSAMQIKNSMDISLFDDEYRDVVGQMAAEGVTNKGKQISPHSVRLGIYRFFIDEVRRVSPDTPISICMETNEMWQELSDELKMTKENYACCCGPVSVPGHPMLI